MANKLTELGGRIVVFNADLFRTAQRMAALAQERADIIEGVKGLGIGHRQAAAMLGSVTFSVAPPGDGFEPDAPDAALANGEVRTGDIEGNDSGD